MRTIFLVGVGLIVTASAVACSSEDDRPSSAGTSGGSSGGTDGGVRTDGSSVDGASIDASNTANDAEAGTMTLTSPAFTAGGAIPKAHSCDGAGESIPLAWSGAPLGTKSFAVVMRDLTFTNGGNNYHWVIWDIPASTTSVQQGIAHTPTPDPPGGGAKQTYWSYGAQIGYGNMCPISGPSTHEYELTVHAFSVAMLPLGGAEGPNAIDAVIQANTIASGSLRGTYMKE